MTTPDSGRCRRCLHSRQCLNGTWCKLHGVYTDLRTKLPCDEHIHDT